MLTLTKRAYLGESDLDAIAHLINCCDAVDQLEQGTTVGELQTEFSTPSIDTQRDLQLWENEDGELIGFGYLWITEPSDSIDGFLSFYIHPNHRQINLESAILAWGEQRMGEVKQKHQIPTRFGLSARDSQRERIQMIENHGFKVTRYFFTMERNLTETIPQPQLPTGYSIRQMNRETDIPAWVEMFNQSFVDHWNHHDLTVENMIHFINEPSYKPDLNLIAIASDNTFVSTCECQIFPEDNKRTGRKEGWIGVLGTIRSHRKMGLGTAMLLSGLHKLKSVGMNTARLGVDADNPSGALRLYESVGFDKVYTKIVYIKSV
ncbi:GNAT family N-acetyltransferase [Calothrix sp. 336/3]|uniref:GNAT family N-acetyltransferase n=1 Tax=Calothrix sp. 336/3 TaxID=1337936 RepID=UPI0004E31E58|nr:GNAT family N-acetyltransferase [Calothrix sp. 336/3]AKG20704.1 acetyltransferase [Calothrix sp. 336/3]